MKPRQMLQSMSRFSTADLITYHCDFPQLSNNTAGQVSGGKPSACPSILVLPLCRSTYIHIDIDSGSHPTKRGGFAKCHQAPTNHSDFRQRQSPAAKVRAAAAAAVGRSVGSPLTDHYFS